ncbi:MAG: MBL fold metallo-hydrolase [Solirubrobacteraceae bacterium]|nr:MBL fold metallo-hydrolase [Solirubrobacteraceae bacterium]
MDEVADGVVRIVAPLQFGDPPEVNCYLVRTAEGPLLVDAAMVGSEEAIDAAVAAGGEPVARVLITHSHPDHWGLAVRYADRVLVHPDAHAQMRNMVHPDAVERTLPPGWKVERAVARLVTGYGSLLAGVPEMDPIADGDRVGEWDVIGTSGHGTGHVALYRARDGVLIAGDQLLEHVVPGLQVTVEMPDSLEECLRSLDRVEALDVRLVLPGHGAPFTDAAGRIAEIRTYHHERLAELERLLAEGPETLSVLADRVHGAPMRRAMRLRVELETHAYLEHLRLRGRAELDRDLWRRS